MEIYLIRHTTPDIDKGICYGQADIGLADDFLKEAKNTVQQLPPSIDHVYTSPLKRCLQLAGMIPHQALEQVSALQEMDFGDWELKAWSDIPESDLNPWMADFVNEKVPNGESMKVMANRVISWYHLLKDSKSEKIAIVTHAGPIRILLSEVNKTPLEEAFDRYPVAYGEVIKIQ